jgi:hypothetical protein
MRRQSVVLRAATLAGLTGLCEADLCEWSVRSGGNGRFYEAVLVPEGIDWEEASAAARGGYLATITSAQENAFVYELVDDPVFRREAGPGSPNGTGPFLGGYRAAWDPLDPAANWAWVTRERWAYTNRVEIEPSGDATQNRLQFFGYYSLMGPLWNDLPRINCPQNGYVVEFNVNPVLFPGTAPLGMIGLGTTGWRLRCRTC